MKTEKYPITKGGRSISLFKEDFSDYSWKCICQDLKVVEEPDAVQEIGVSINEGLMTIWTFEPTVKGE